MRAWTAGRRKPAMPVAERPELDAGASELHQLIETVTTGMDAYDVTDERRAIERFVDDLSNWYIRRSAAASGSRRAMRTRTPPTDALRVLVTVAHLLAAVHALPRGGEYRNLVGSVDPDAVDSVHLRDWPVANAAAIDAD